MFRRWRLCAVLTDGGKYERCDVYIAYHADCDDGIADEICRDEACPNSSESGREIVSIIIVQVIQCHVLRLEEADAVQDKLQYQKNRSCVEEDRIYPRKKEHDEVEQGSDEADCRHL